MSPQFPGFLLIVVIVVVAVLLLAAGSRKGGGPGGTSPQRGCNHCGAAHPHFAEFCRRCGKRLG